MERSAVNSYTVAGAFIGVLIGLYVAWRVLGLRDPGWMFFVASVIGMLLTAAAHQLVSRRFKHAGRGERVFLAVSGWIVLVVAMIALILGVDAIFPKAIAGANAADADITDDLSDRANASPAETWRARG